MDDHIRVLFEGDDVVVPCCVGQTVEHALSIMYTRHELERDIAGIRKKESQAMHDKDDIQREMKKRCPGIKTRAQSTDRSEEIRQLEINMGGCLKLISDYVRQIESKEAEYEAIDENTALAKLKLFPKGVFDVVFEDNYETVSLQSLVTEDMMKRELLVTEKFSGPCEKKMKYADMKPPFCEKSPSEIASSNFELPFDHEEVEPFYHWVAVELQDSFNNPDNEGIFKDYIAKITNQKLDLAVERFLAIKDHQSDLNVNEHECVSLFYNALNQLIFDDQDEISLNAACLPQCPVQGTKRTDFSMLCLFGHLPIKCFLHSDYKPINLIKAIKETLCYAVCANQSNESHPYSWSFGLPCTSKEMRLLLCLPGNNSMHTIKVASVEIKNDVKFRNFLKILYALTHWRVVDIMEHPDPGEVGRTPCGCEPVKGLVLRNHFEGHSSKRVFYDQSKKKVYKIYRKQGDSKKPNVLLMEQLGYFKNLELKDIGSSYQLLSYDLLEGFIKPKCKKHIEEAKKILQQIHDYGYVHADVRQGNIVFAPPSSSCKAYFIDFDFAGEEDEKYHEYYNGDLGERHHDAKPGMLKKFCHDDYSLEQIAAFYGFI